MNNKRINFISKIHSFLLENKIYKNKWVYKKYFLLLFNIKA